MYVCLPNFFIRYVILYFIQFNTTRDAYRVSFLYYLDLYELFGKTAQRRSFSIFKNL